MYADRKETAALGTQIREINAKNILSRSKLSPHGFAANPYVGCAHACTYCYATYMQRFAGREGDWGTWVDVRHWPDIRDPWRYAGKEILLGSVTDPYQPAERTAQRTRTLLEQLDGSGCRLRIMTKSDLVVRDLDLIRRYADAQVTWSINTTDEAFRRETDHAVSIDRRLSAMQRFHDAGVRTACFIAPIFPCLTDVPAVIEAVMDRADSVWMDSLNLRADNKSRILRCVAECHPELESLYSDIYNQGNRQYWKDLDEEIRAFASEHHLPYRYGHEQDVPCDTDGTPEIVNFFIHGKPRYRPAEPKQLSWDFADDASAGTQI